jgi:hypothetical protein
MGCHTWFSVPYVKNDKAKVIELAQEFVNTSPYLTADHKKMYQYAIDAELHDVIKELATSLGDGKDYGEPWTLYLDITDYSLMEYNKLNGTNYKSKYDKEVYEKIDLESYSDEPRIGGYPEHIIIRTYDQMVEFMKTGFDDKEGKHYNFYYDESRKENFMEGIRTFFYRHPDGIITFG